MPLKSSCLDLIPSGAPSAVEGRLYYDSTAKELKYYNGSSWVEVMRDAD